MGTGRLFIIGIDGVDIPIAREEDLLFGNTVEWDLSEYPELHTLRIWPSMYLGELPHRSDSLPDPLGHKPGDDTLDGANWYSKKLQIASKVSHLLLPKSVRVKIGAYLENKGHAKTEPEREDWPDTVFDGVSSKVINLPAYNPLPVQKKLKRGWKERIQSGSAGLEELEELAEQERNEIRAELESAMEYGYEIVWAYVYGPDIFGHVDYEYGYPRQIQTTWKEIVEFVEEKMDDDDTLVVISDHGMELDEGVGEHRPPGWISTDADTGLPSSPVAVREWIETELGSRARKTEETLEDLGYL